MDVQPVTGGIALDQLGRTLMHEHLFIAFPGAEFDPSVVFDRRSFVAEAVRQLRQPRTGYGARGFVDPCPMERGRETALRREIAEASEMNIICATGLYFEEVGLPDHKIDLILHDNPRRLFGEPLPRLNQV